MIGIVAAALLAASAAAPTAKQLNDQGFDAYKKGDLGGAATLFERAIEADPKLAMAHYNLACALARLRAAGTICGDREATRSAILEELRAAVHLDPGRAERARKDADLANVHDTVGWQELIEGADPKNQLTSIITKTSWWTPGQGAFGSLVQMKFALDGTLAASVRIIKDDGSMGAPTTIKGTWNVVQGRIKMHFDQPILGVQDTTGDLIENRIKLPEDDPLRFFMDEPDECSA